MFAVNTRATWLLAKAAHDALAASKGAIVAVGSMSGSHAHANLGRLAMQTNQFDMAVREFKAVVVLDPVDQAAARTDLAESLLKSGKRSEARKQTLDELDRRLGLGGRKE